MGHQLKELSRLQHAITVGVANLEQLGQVALEHVSRHLVPHWHALANLRLQVSLIGCLHQAQHGRHKLLVPDHAILIHISSLHQGDHHMSREVEARPAQQVSKLDWAQHAIVVGVSNLEQLLQVVSHHVSWHISRVGHSKLLNCSIDDCFLHGIDHSQHSRHELLVLDHAILVGISLQEKLQHKLRREPQTSTGHQLKELSWLQHAITVGVPNLAH